MLISKERYILFGDILTKVMSRINCDGKIVGYKDEGDKVIFKFKPVNDLDSIYPSIQDDGYDIIRDMMNSDALDIRKHKGNLEMRFPDTVVYMANAILRYNPKLEF